MTSLRTWCASRTSILGPFLEEPANRPGLGLNWDCYVPCVEPKGDPGGTGSPRGPPLERRLWLGDETNRDDAKWPRMAATTRGHKIQSEVSERSVSQYPGIIKTRLTPRSRKYFG